MCVGEDEMSEFLVFILNLAHARARSLLVVDISLIALHMRKRRLREDKCPAQGSLSFQNKAL